MRTFLRVSSLLLCLIAMALGQEFRATVTGTVTDSQGAVIAGAKITAVNNETKVAVSTTTNAAGVYILPYLTYGTYTVTASTKGFNDMSRPDVLLQMGARKQLDFTLALAALSQQVTVTAETGQLETATADLGLVIDTHKVADIPLMGRNPFMLSLLSPGTTMTYMSPGSTMNPYDNGGMDSMSINGSGGESNEFMLDGTSDTTSERGSLVEIAFVPSPDATSEFRVQTNNYDAQYGRTYGGTVSTSLKNGTNDYHGAAYWYLRNDKLNANSYTANAAGSNKTAYRWAQPGLELDGPIVIPHLYNGKNKSFFMFSWEKIKNSTPSVGTLTVPTDAERTGDFSGLHLKDGSMVTIYDPLSTVTNKDGSYSRTPFVGNAIPASRLNTVGKNLLSYFPKANYSGDGTVGGQSNNYVFNGANTDEYDQFAVRQDQVINDKVRFWAHFVRGNRHQVSNDEGFANKAATTNYTHYRISNGGAFGVTEMLSPTLVNDTRVSFIRHQFAIANYADGFDMSSLGFSDEYTSSVKKAFFPSISASGMSNMGAAGSMYSHNNLWQVADTVTKILGKHTLKMGGEFRSWRINWAMPTSDGGAFSFNAAFTGLDPMNISATSGSGVASLLLGYPVSGTVTERPDLAYQSTYQALYVQDDWRISKRLTLNLGLRWDYEPPLTERYNRQNAGWAADTVNPVNVKVNGEYVKGGLLFTSADNRYATNKNWKNFQPRIGGAYQIDSKTVFRAGYGLVFTPQLNLTGTTGYTMSTSYISSLDGGVTPANSLTNPFPNGILTATGAAGGLSTALGQGVAYTYVGRETPRVHQFSAGIQRELPGHVVAEAAYSGARGTHLDTSYNVNQLPLSDYLQGSAYLNTQVTNPFAGLVSGSSLNNATIVRSQLVRPYPEFIGGISENGRTIGKSWYNALDVKVQKRFSHGLHVLFSYTWAKNLRAIGYLNSGFDGIGNLATTYVSYDQPNRAVISAGYELPVLKNAQPFLKGAFGGWQVNTVVTALSGFPVSAPSGVNSTGVSPVLDNPTGARMFNTCTILVDGTRRNCASSSEAAAWVVRSSTTLSTLSSVLPGVRYSMPTLVDMSLFKTFPVYERLKLQFRAEAFNMTNTAWFGDLNTSYSSSAFGSLSIQQANSPRNVQLSLRALF